MAELFFTQTKLSMLDKSGKAKPDAEGYYTIVIGGLETHNNSGAWYYTAEGILELFGPGSLLHRKIANGCLRAEVGHPRQRDQEKFEHYMDRMMDIDLNNVCAHFKEVWIDKDFGKNHPEYKNPKLVGIMGKVKPAGPKGDILKSALENDSENICFSIRSLADQQYVNGRVQRKLLEIVTFDLVNEGGITVASKWDSPATESASYKTSEVMSMTPVPIQSLRKLADKKRNAVFSLESTVTADFILRKYADPERPASIFKKW